MVSKKHLLLGLIVLGGCAHDPRRFRLLPPVRRDQDLDAVSVKCRPDPEAKGADKISCTPEEYESSFQWDAADNLFFRPISKFFQADNVGEAKNVNAFDEVADSSWFVNRIGTMPMSPDEAARGFCPFGPELKSNPEDGAWVIDHGKDNGANPGFRVAFGGAKFMFKTDDFQVERATAATAIASRFYFTAGWWAPCDAVVYFRRSALKLTPGLEVKANAGPVKNFDEKMLDATLSKTGRRGELYRATASRFIPGKPLGPFTYEGKREDDPSDVIDHEDRRDLRGARVIAAWLNHFDSREQNTMSTWMADDPKNPRSKGRVRHWYIDLGDCMGSEWEVDGFSRRHGHSYVFDFGDISTDFATFGMVDRPWDHAKRTPGLETFGYFTSEDFDPDLWRGEYPNPAFSRMTERDAAWAARIVSRITPAHIAAMVHIGDFSNPGAEPFLTRVLVERRQILLKRYFAKLSPMSDVSIEGSKLCAVDLARRAKVYLGYRYSAAVKHGTHEWSQVPAKREEDGRACIPLPNQASDGGEPDDEASRYTVVALNNGTGSGPLLVHLYDLGPRRGFQVVGLERPEPRR